jgi:hypothetical protein
MKRCLILALTFLIGASVAAAQKTKTGRIDLIAQRIAEAYGAKDLGRLDAARLIRGRVRIRIGYVEETPDTVRSFRSFKAVETWLDQRAEKGIDNPGRYVRDFAGCRKGSCDFTDMTGSLHNQLYLQDISYGYRKGRWYIREISLWNGD